MTEETPKSITLNERIDTLDLLRGVAICGILLMNIPVMGGLWHVAHPPYPASWNIDWITYAAQRFFFEGSMRGLFTLLFGAGMLVMLRKAEREGVVAPVDVFVRRCVALMFLGVVQFAIFLWPGEILFNYGMTDFFLLTFRNAKPKTMLIAALLGYIVFAGFYAEQTFEARDKNAAAVQAQSLAAAHKPLTKDQQKAIERLQQWQEGRNPPAKAIQEEVTKRTHFPSVLSWSANLWVDYNLTPESWVWFVESLIGMLIGMTLFRLKILTGERSVGFYVRLAVICYGIGLPLRIASNLLEWKAGLAFDFGGQLFGQTQYEPARLLMSVGHVGLLCALYKTGMLGRAWPVRALGRMALTTYSLQSILTSILFYGFGMLHSFGFAELMATAACIWVITGVFAVLWLRKFDQGPAEYVLRRMAYGRNASGPRAVPGPDWTLATA